MLVRRDIWGRVDAGERWGGEKWNSDGRRNSARTGRCGAGKDARTKQGGGRAMSGVSGPVDGENACTPKEVAKARTHEDGSALLQVPRMKHRGRRVYSTSCKEHGSPE